MFGGILAILFAFIMNFIRVTFFMYCKLRVWHNSINQKEALFIFRSRRTQWGIYFCHTLCVQITHRHFSQPASCLSRISVEIGRSQSERVSDDGTACYTPYWFCSQWAKSNQTFGYVLWETNYAYRLVWFSVRNDQADINSIWALSPVETVFLLCYGDWIFCEQKISFDFFSRLVPFETAKRPNFVKKSYAYMIFGWSPQQTLLTGSLWVYGK